MVQTNSPSNSDILPSYSIFIFFGHTEILVSNFLWVTMLVFEHVWARLWPVTAVILVVWYKYQQWYKVSQHESYCVHCYIAIPSPWSPLNTMVHHETTSARDIDTTTMVIDPILNELTVSAVQVLRIPLLKCSGISIINSWRKSNE